MTRQPSPRSVDAGDAPKSYEIADPASRPELFGGPLNASQLISIGLFLLGAWFLRPRAAAPAQAVPSRR